MRHRVAGALWLLLACSALAAPKIKGEVRYEPFAKIVLKASDVSSAKAQFLWDVDGSADYVDAGETLYVWAAPGKYRVTLTAVDFDAKKIERAKFSFQVGDVPPTPGPGPKPPDPPTPPTPGPVPIDAPGVNVLMVFDKDTVSKLPPAQNAVLYGTAPSTLRGYLATKGASVRIWAADENVTNAPQAWRDAMKRPMSSLPWLMISNKDKGTGYEGPLPASNAAAVELARKYVEGAKARSGYRRAAERAGRALAEANATRRAIEVIEDADYRRLSRVPYRRQGGR